MKLPKRLPIDRACFIELPASEVAKGDLPGYELEYRRQYPGMFHSRSGYYFFFEFPHTVAREAFLTAMQKEYTKARVLAIRSIIYPD